MHPRYRISNIPRYKIRNLNTFVKRKEGRVSVSLRNRIRKKKKERRRTLIQSSIETYRSNSSREVETKSKSLGLCIDGKCNEREKSSLSFFFFNGEDSHVLNRGRRKTDRTGYTGYENPSSIPSLP